VTSTPKKRTCARCGTLAWPAASFPEGHLCHPCLDAALRLAGTCPGCGTVAPPLKPLADALAATASPAATLGWLRKPDVRDLLTALASGTLPLTHEAIDAWPRPRAVSYLRELLTDCGALPAADRQLRDYQAWLGRRLGALDGHPHLRLLRQVGQWHQLPAMRARAAAGPLAPTACQYAKSRFNQAHAFLTWIIAAGVRPSALTQAHIDAYYNTCRPYQREPFRAFLTWAAGHGHIPARLDIPRQKHPPGQAITQKRRLELLRRFATDAGIRCGPAPLPASCCSTPSPSPASCG
jgi:hypothetical protein